ncbi:MAG: alpha/beta hydrolase-fold protein [Gammaproteobacteria bacterium]|nr:alpha/beta hydrolase-fold protein [Gammaproteobacteria bacterium]
MRCVPRITAFPWLFALLAGAGSLAQESVLLQQGVATELVPGEARFDLLLPPEYAPEREVPYPLLLWLHGGSGGENQLERRLRPPLEHAWAKGTIEPVVVVAPLTGNSYWIDWKGGGNDWETFLITELLAHVRGAYHVAQDRAGTLIGGASAGGQGTLRIALRNPETFAAAAALEPGFPPVMAFADLDVTPYGPGALRFLERRFGNPVDVAYWQARHPPTIVIDNAARLRESGLQLLVEAGDEDANLTFLSAELVHRLLFDAAIEHEYHLVRGAAHTGRSVPRRLENMFAFFQRALRPEGPDPAAERHLANAKRTGRYAPRVPNQLHFETVDFGAGAGTSLVPE